MKIVLLAGLMLLSATAASAENAVRPEVVRLENVLVEGEMRTVYVGNANNHYLIYCNTKAEGCFTPEEDKNYFLFTESTRWKLPGAKDFLTLAYLQEFFSKYNQGENVALVPEDNKGDRGVFIRDPTGGGYERDTVISDGPIVYGTGMSDADLKRAWQAFFTQMLKIAMQQQGKDVVLSKLARRCMPGEEFCTAALDANLVGVAGLQEPRKVVLMVSSDVHDDKKHLARLVCTYPSKGTVICRDWSTGKLVSVKHPEQ
ncbi:hypothetical protein [Bradyrhizobium sp. I1.7.5]|uniref:hypothetical protein n=1 Tax=Bradyrhizobium sp. I1.7.5 TaxID=3156363 RepID=UPI0033993905